VQLIAIEGNSQKLDGGAMFGHAPKALWSRWVDVDELNRINLACRALLIKYENRNILLETGIGAFFSPDLKDRYGVIEEQHVLLDNLAKHGLSHQDIDIVILSHLHFDHAGGLLAPWQEDKELALLFPKADFFVGDSQWQRAKHPHPRDKASYIQEIQTLLEESGRLKIIKKDTDNPLPDLLEFRWSDGHTPGLMMSLIKTKKGPLVFASDLIPGVPWVHLPIVMAYDRFPEIIIEEKQKLYDELLPEGGYIFFVHDAATACGKLAKDEKGKYSVSKINLEELSK